MLSPRFQQIMARLLVALAVAVSAWAAQEVIDLADDLGNLTSHATTHLLISRDEALCRLPPGLSEMARAQNVRGLNVCWVHEKDVFWVLCYQLSFTGRGQRHQGQ